jgi:hypothetical protein
MHNTHRFRQIVDFSFLTGMAAIALIACVHLGVPSVVAADSAAAAKPSETKAAIAVLDDDLPGFDRTVVKSLVEELRKADFTIETLTAQQVCDPGRLSPGKFFLYIIPQCRTYPAAGLDSLTRFTQGRGHVLFLGGPFLDDPVWSSGAGWFNRDAIQKAKNDAPPQHLLWEARSLSASGWQRSCSDPSSPGSWEVVPQGPQGQSCFRFWAKNLTNWDGYMAPTAAPLFGPQHDLLSFQIKGGPGTRQLVVEIQEEDGSRWMSVVDIGPEWKRVGLGPEDFQYWVDSPTRKDRGKAGDRLQPQQARRIGFQIAFSHTTAVAPGEHSFFLADIGSCVHPFKNLTLTPPDEGATLETILPRYKVYGVEKPVTLQGPLTPGGAGEVKWPPVSNVVCGIARTTGRGFARDQKWRFVPLLEALDDNRQSRGSAAWMLLNNTAPYAGTAFACLGINDPATLRSPTAIAAVRSIAARLRAGLYFRDAGAEQFAYWPGEPIRLGASVGNAALQNRKCEVRLTLRDRQDKVLWTQATSLDVAPRADQRWENLSATVDSRPAMLKVAAELIQDGLVVDRIDHDIRVLDAGVPSKGEFITVRGNQFYLGEQPWYPVGVNYWPLYVSGMQLDDFWTGWLHQRYYDPELVEHDLQLMEGLGINLVSIQSSPPQHYRNLLDFTARCRAHRIYVNLFCGFASPLEFREKELKDYITTARLADNSTIVAYDTIWEPGNYVFQGDRRAGWDDEWRAWVVEQYGSIEAAEAEWKFKGRRDPQGKLISPDDQNFRDDGPWRTMMAAYRRFMDDFTSNRWNHAHRMLRKIDPNHLISFRQGNTLPHDFVFTGTPKHIDFICPEGYSIEPNENGYYSAGFITKYVHFTTRGKPIVWSEFGQSVWDFVNMKPAPARIAEVAKYHEMFYKMVLETGANGTIPWWWPGGYREGEKSDFGIMNPDASRRPIAQLIADYGDRIKTHREWPAATAWFDMDRDAHAGGYWYVCFNSGRDAYRRAAEAGKHLDVRTAGTGTDSATTPLVAVGNQPCTGKNPPKYLNAEFNWLMIQDATGQWVEAADGRSITVSSSAPLKARVCVGNTQEATWLAPQGGAAKAGDVVLQTTETSELKGQWPLPAGTRYLADADFGEIVLADRISKPTKIELRMNAVDRTGFGEKRTFTVNVK